MALTYLENDTWKKEMSDKFKMMSFFQTIKNSQVKIYLLVTSVSSDWAGENVSDIEEADGLGVRFISESTNSNESVPEMQQVVRYANCLLEL